MIPPADGKRNQIGERTGWSSSPANNHILYQSFVHYMYLKRILAINLIYEKLEPRIPRNAHRICQQTANRKTKSPRTNKKKDQTQKYWLPNVTPNRHRKTQNHIRSNWSVFKLWHTITVHLFSSVISNPKKKKKSHTELENREIKNKNPWFSP